MYPENLPIQYTSDLKPEEIPTLDVRTRRRAERFLKYFEQDINLSVTAACKKAKIHPLTLAKLMQYPEFKFLKASIDEIRRQRIEDYSVEQCFTPKATLERMFHLKQKDPTYRDKQEIRSGNITININPEAVHEAFRRQAAIDAEVGNDKQ